MYYWVLSFYIYCSQGTYTIYPDPESTENNKWKLSLGQLPAQPIAWQNTDPIRLKESIQGPPITSFFETTTAASGKIHHGQVVQGPLTTLLLLMWVLDVGSQLYTHNTKPLFLLWIKMFDWLGWEEKHNLRCINNYCFISWPTTLKYRPDSAMRWFI